MTADTLSATPSFGDLLREHRLAAGLTQEELTERAGLSRRGISDLERGARTRPQRQTLQLLADGLGLVGAERATFLRAGRRPSHLGALEAQSPQVGLSVPPDAFVGREEESAHLLAILCQSDTRLVTLSGPGGSGKTRLALEVGSKLSATYHDGVSFLDLAAMTDPDLLFPHIATTLGVRESGVQSLLAQVAGALKGRRVLLILDNLEQFHPFATMSRTGAELLATIPGLVMLATSRAPLRLRLEREVPVPPLPVPAGDEASLERLLASPSVKLFAARAAAARPGFTVSSNNAEAVGALCRHLDGLPLAIELAAARLRSLSPADILVRLADRLDLLTDRGGERPDRQRTLEATIAWSVDLLDSPAQSAFRRLAIFSGGFTLEAAEAVLMAVAASDADPLTSLEVLVEQGLLLADERPDGSLRYRMLETVRTYGHAQLREHAEEDAARQAHAAYFATMGFEAERQMRLAPLPYLAQLEPEIANVRAALTWAAAHEQTETGLWLSLTFGAYTYFRGRLAEVRQWMMHFLADDVPALAALRARVFVQAGWTAYLEGETELVRRAANEVVALASGEPKVLADGLNLLACVAQDEGSLAEARRLFEEALNVAQTCPDPDGVVPVILNNLGFLAYCAGDFNEARRWYEAALATLPDGVQLMRPGLLSNLGAIARDDGDRRLAARLYGEALGLHRVLRTTEVADTLELAAEYAVVTGSWEAAGRFLGIADALRQRAGATIAQQNVMEHEQVLAATRQQLGEIVLAAAWADGQSLSLDEAISEAERLLAEVAGIPTG